jgi:hypothetical protein
VLFTPRFDRFPQIFRAASLSLPSHDEYFLLHFPRSRRTAAAAVRQRYAPLRRHRDDDAAAERRLGRRI